MRTIAITQPTYLPWMGYFEMIYQADVFVFLDSVQFEKQCWQSRNRIRTPSGDTIWLSAPVSKHPLSTPLSDIELAPNPANWRKKHLKSIIANLQKAPFFPDIEPYLSEFYTRPHTLLADQNIELITELCSHIGLETEFVRSSELSVPGQREELLINICREFSGDRYYSNAGSSDYLDESRMDFEKAGIRLDYQDWEHPVYEQMGEGFVSHLSVIDGLACIGREKTLEEVSRS